MAQLVKMGFSGGKEMIKSLERMDHKARRNTVTRAMRRALNPFRTKLQSAIKSELLTMHAQARAIYAKQIYISFKVERNNILAGNIRARNKVVDTPNGRTRFSSLAHMFEGGVKPHKVHQPKMRRTIKHPGIRAIPVWSKEFDNESQNMVNDFAKLMFSEIEKEWNKGK